MADERDEEPRERSIGEAKMGRGKWRSNRYVPGQVTNLLSHRPQAEKDKVGGKVQII